MGRSNNTITFTPEQRLDLAIKESKKYLLQHGLEELNERAAQEFKSIPSQRATNIPKNTKQGDEYLFKL